MANVNTDPCALVAESHDWAPESAFTADWGARRVDFVCPPGEAATLVKVARRAGYFSRPGTMQNSVALMTRVAPVGEAIVAMGGREREVGRALIAVDATAYVVARCWQPPCDGCAPTRAIFSIAGDRIVASYVHEYLQGHAPLQPRLHDAARAAPRSAGPSRLGLAGILVRLEDPLTFNARDWPTHATVEGRHHAPTRTLIWRDPLTGGVEAFEDAGPGQLSEIAAGDVPERYLVVHAAGPGRGRAVVQDGRGRLVKVDRTRHAEFTRPIVDDIVRRWNEQVQLSGQTYERLLRRV
jgi:hypothetical protein